MPKLVKEKVKFYNSEETIDWNKTVNKENGYRISLGLCNIRKILEYVRDEFGSKEDFFQFPNEKTYMATIGVNNDGVFQEGSLEITYFSCFLGKMNRKKQEDIYQNLSGYFETISKELKVLFDQLFKDTTLEMANLNEMQQMLEKYLSLPSGLFLSKREGFILDFAIETLSNHENTVFMNSFYLDDLQKVLHSEEISPALTTYLNGSKISKLDIDENRKELEKWIHPSKIPTARWPSPAHFKLSLMQQVAVNIILSGEANVDSVNGPPGTGKTTLLKDVFAAIIFRRAKDMASFVKPLDAFTKLDYSVETSSRKIIPFEITENLLSHSMIVASSNNSAVENISKELPLKKEVMRECDNEFRKVEQEFENEIYQLSSDLNYFRNIAAVLLNGQNEVNDIEIETSAWGLFSATLGNSKNIENFEKLFWFVSKDKPNRIADELSNHRYTQDNWESAKKELLDLEEKIQNKKKELSKVLEETLLYEKMEVELTKGMKRVKEQHKELNELEEERSTLELENDRLEKILESFPKVGIFNFLTKRGRDIKEELFYYEKKNNEITKKLYYIGTEIINLKKQIKDREELQKSLVSKIENIRHKLEKLREEGMTIPDSKYWDKDNYYERQKSVPWITIELNHLRSQAFIAAMKVHKIFLSMASNAVKSNLSILFNRKSIDTNFKDNTDAIKLGWQTLFLIIPVISTTFASASRFLKYFNSGEIGHLFIDEAGQAVPQAAVGSIWRSRHVVAVGDPLQIEPVVGLPETLLRDIREYYQVDEAFMSLNSSVQSVADLSNSIGKWKSEQQWIGVPLWVHRRCYNPMFTIANKIAYDDRMVLYKEYESENSYWIDVTGKAVINQYVKEEGQVVLDSIIRLFKESSIKGEFPSVYIITPFTTIKEELKKLLVKNSNQLQRLIGKTKKEVCKWITQSIGTVHTFQGKEADTVFFVIGTDETQQGAASWIVSKPNLVNVAATRAKKNFIVVGDYDRLSKMAILETVSKHLQRRKGFDY